MTIHANSNRADAPLAPLRDVRSLRHGFSAWTASALTISGMRPLVGIAAAVYLISHGGLGSWLAVLAVLVMLLVVASVFGELASRWPLEGSVYAWSRQLMGPHTGFLAGWAYLWGCMFFMAALSFFDTQRIFFLLGLQPPDHLQAALANVLLVGVATALNASGRAYFKAFVMTSAAVSVLGVLAFGTVLLVSHRQRSFAELFASPTGAGLDWAWFGGPFLVAVAFASSFAFRGFELPAEVAEEVRNPRRNVPRVMIWTLLGGGLITLYGVVALAMAVPGLGSVAGALDKSLYAGSLASTVRVALGEDAAQLLTVLFILATFSSAAVFQLAASRSLWTLARDRQIPGDTFLVKLTTTERLPVRALVVVGLIAAALPFVIDHHTAFLLQLASCAPLLLAFLLPILGLIRLRARGGWRPGPWSLGPWGMPAALIAALSLTLLSVNALWPRSGGTLYGTPASAWFQSIVLAVIVVTGIGLHWWGLRAGRTRPGEDAASIADAPQRIRLAHTGTCIFCLEPMAAAQEAFWDPQTYGTLCVPCHKPSNLAILELASRARGTG